MPSDSAFLHDPLAFALSSLAARGALVEHGSDGGTAIIPPEVARQLELPEVAELSTLAEDSSVAWCGLGSSLLDRMIAEARAKPELARVESTTDTLRSSRARALAEGFVVRNGVTDVVECLAGRLEYQFAVAGWVAETDDRHEGVVYAGISVCGGRPDDRMERMLWDAALNAADGYREAADHDALTGKPCIATDGPVAARSIERLRNTLERRALAFAEPLRAAALRRQAREYRQTTEYYDAMVKEVQAPRRKIDPATLESRVAAVVVDRDAKIRDLEQRFRVRVTLTPVARIVASVATTTVRARVRRRQSERILELHLPTGAQAFDGLSCDGCLGHTHRPALCDEKLHVLCEACIPEARGRVPCPTCRGASRP